MLVYSQPDPLSELKLLLESQGVKTLVARSCGEAALRLWGLRPLHTVFTDIQLSDGTWEDLIGLAEKAPWAVNVIVVSRLVDIQLYLETLDRGAFDFLTPPFFPTGVASLLRASSLKAAREKAGKTALPARQKAMRPVSAEWGRARGIGVRSPATVTES